MVQLEAQCKVLLGEHWSVVRPEQPLVRLSVQQTVRRTAERPVPHKVLHLAPHLSNEGVPDVV
jgi:hypothetical protein